MNEAGSSAAEVLASVRAAPRFVPGYSRGIGQPVAWITLRVAAQAFSSAAPVASALAAELRAAAESQTAPAESHAEHAAGHAAGQWVSQQVARWARILLEQADQPVLYPERVAGAASDPDEWRIFLPCLDREAGFRALRAAVDLTNRCAALEAGVAQGSLALAQALDQVRPSLQRARKALAARRLKGFNMVHFLHAAQALDVPWSRVTADVFQIGWGSRSRWLNSSITDETGAVSSRMARDKPTAAAVLRAAGLPVPPHGLVSSADQAVELAQRLGWPVVVKPSDQDGGVGVSAHLDTIDEVREAFDAARKYSRLVVVERHFHGRDHRVHVVRGQVLGVLERVPGSVVGDGQRSVSQLVDRQNQERRLATDDRRFLKAISMDAEALRMLRAQGLQATSVPATGQVVRLRAAANVASGGVPVPLELDRIHPDNLELAVRAARALRLDVAGIDLLIADITRSWLDIGAAICEVNAQPQMFTTMHEPTLRRVLRGTDGRIPVVVVMDNRSGGRIAQGIHQQLLHSRIRAGLAGPQSVWIGPRRVARSAQPMPAWQCGQIVLRDPQAGALVLHVDSPAMVENEGWPVDRCDVLVWALAPGSAAVPAWTRMAGWLKCGQVLASPQTVEPDAQLVRAATQALAPPLPPLAGAGAA